MVVSDDYSRFPVIETVNSIRQETVIPALDKILSEFGTPTVIRSDNGAPFNSD